MKSYFTGGAVPQPNECVADIALSLSRPKVIPQPAKPFQRPSGGVECCVPLVKRRCQPSLEEESSRAPTNSGVALPTSAWAHDNHRLRSGTVNEDTRCK